MARARKPSPVKLFCALLAGREEWLEMARERLEQEFGPIGMESAVWDFDFTDYYEDQMGPGLLRRFYAFRELIDPEDIVELKLALNRLEGELADEIEGGPERPLNIDPGYVGMSKMVLATAKDYAHRIYLRAGIYAESTLKWRDGEFRPWEWTYPDYKTEHYREFLGRVRRKYADQLRERKRDETAE